MWAERLGHHSSMDSSATLHPAVPGSNPKHIFYTFSIYSNIVLYLSLQEMDENEQKEAGFGPC